MSKRQLLKKICKVCGDVFWTVWHSKNICPDCTEFRQKCRASSRAIHGRTKLTGNMAAIERVNREAAAQGLSYGKLEGKRYAEKHVRVERKESG